MRLLAPELRYGLVVLVASLALTLQYSIDIVVMKHYFSATTAGLYAGIAAVARILFFLTASIAQVLISAVKLKQTAAQNRQLLYKSLFFLCAISLPILFVLVIWPAQIVRVLMGGAYTPLAALLPRLSIAIFIVAVLNLLVAYYLALRRFGVAIPVVAGLGVSYALILWHHGSPMAVVSGLLMGSSAMLGLFGVWAVIERKRMHEAT
jgi:O-antigen/teichoic acid export membrane protein